MLAFEKNAYNDWTQPSRTEAWPDNKRKMLAYQKIHIQLFSTHSFTTYFLHFYTQKEFGDWIYSWFVLVRMKTEWAQCYFYLCPIYIVHYLQNIYLCFFPPTTLLHSSLPGRRGRRRSRYVKIGKDVYLREICCELWNRLFKKPTFWYFSGSKQLV